jgi:hypothetical protein
MYILPLSVQADPGLISVRVLICVKEWSSLELDTRRFSLVSGEEEHAAMPAKRRLDPFVPVNLRLEFPVPDLADSMQLRYKSGLLSRGETFELLPPALDEEAMRELDAECHAAWLARAFEVEQGYRPSRWPNWRTGEVHLDEALSLLERYLHVHPQDEVALGAHERVRLKKELVRDLRSGNWLRVNRLNEEILRRQDDWDGPRTETEEAFETATRALEAGLLEVAEERLRQSFEAGIKQSDAALLLARLFSAWGRDIEESARWYLRYFEHGGPGEWVVHEAMRVLDDLGALGPPYRATLLEHISERLVERPEDPELADLVYHLAEQQAAAGLDVSDEHALLWISYEQAFEQQMVIDGRVDRTLLGRLEKLYTLLGNADGWIRLLHRLADMEPSRPEHRRNLACRLSEHKRHAEALGARMSLWLNKPMHPGDSAELIRAAEAAGENGLAARAKVWLSFIAREPCDEPVSRIPEIPARLLVHPEIRSLLPILRSWQGQDSTDTSLQLEGEQMTAALKKCLEPLDRERWNALSSAAQNLPLTPSLSASLLIQHEPILNEMHPLRVAVEVSLDRIHLQRAGTWVGGLRSLGLDWETVNPLQDDGAQPMRRLIMHRLRELGRFYMSRAWDAGGVEWASYPDAPLADLFEAVYLHGHPASSTRTYLDDVRRKQKIPAQDWQQLEMTILRFLRLETGHPFQPLEL